MRMKSIVLLLVILMCLPFVYKSCTSYSILRTAHAGDTVWLDPELQDYGNGWTPVYIGSTEGYILDSYMEF